MSVSQILRRLSILVGATQVLMLLARLATENQDVVSQLESLSPWLAGHAIHLAWTANAIVVVSLISVPVVAAVDPHAESIKRRVRLIFGVWGAIFIVCLSYLLLLVFVDLQAWVFATLSNPRSV